MKQVKVIRLAVEDANRRLLRQVLNKLKGEHQEDLDAQEFLRIVEAGERETLQKLIQINARDLEKSLEEAKEVKSPKERGAPGKARDMSSMQIRVQHRELPIGLGYPRA